MDKEDMHAPVENKNKNSLKKKFIIIEIIITSIVCIILIIVNFISKNNLIISIILSFILISFSSFFISININKLIESIIILKNRITAMAVDSDINSEVPYYNTNDEIQDLSEAIVRMQRTQSCHLNDLIRILDSIADKNFDVKLNCAYPGDYRKQKNSLEKIIQELNSTITEINESALHISQASENVAQGVQVLSNGSSEQASATQELSYTMNKIYEQVKDSSNNAHSASKLAINAGEKMMYGNTRMKELSETMVEISTTSHKISEVIKTIDDISFQTNILALNASIEAARAGEAGKGFVIVAEEVRNLANKTADASRGTTELIESAINAIDSGLQKIEETTEIMTKVMNEAKTATEIMIGISIAASEQEKAIEQLTLSISQISEVITANSATAQQGAASSQELSEQAVNLKMLVKKFKLKTS